MKKILVTGGPVVAIVDFTGQSAGSPWWNETKAVLVESKSGVICYAEIEPTVKVGDIVRPLWAKENLRKGNKIE